MTTRRRPAIALLVAPETSASVLYGLYDVLGTVGPMWPDMTAAQPGDSLLDVRIVAATSDPLRCFGNILVEPHAALDDAGDLDAIVICDMYTPIDTPPAGRYAVETAWLRRQHDQGVLIASVCTGSLLLAESGLLDGRTCAGHWAYADLFAQAYPRIRFQPGRHPRHQRRGGWAGHGRRRDLVAGPRAPPDRAPLRPGARRAHGQGLPVRRPRGRPAPVRRDEPAHPRGRPRDQGLPGLDRGAPASRIR